MNNVNIIFIDSGSNLVISQTKDLRVISLLKTILLDIDFFVLLPVRHKEAFSVFTKEYITDNNVKYFIRKIEPYHENNEELLTKKKIAIEKTKILETLLVCADIKLSGYHHFFHPRMYNIISDSDEKIINEYAFIRNMTVEETNKELKLKKSSFDVHVSKIQALIDSYVEKIIYENSIDVLKNYTDKIILDFWL